jgi:hypothetical protein
VNGHKIIAKMQRIIAILMLGMVLAPAAWGQTVPEELVNAIGRGDAGKMAEYFHQSLEMTILDKEYMTSRIQATRIMEGFFKDHPPTGFTISFEGAKEKSKYAIGALTTEGEEFRVNLFFMNKEDQRLIYYLSIEKESQYEL